MDTHQIGFSKSFPMSTNMPGFKRFSKISAFLQESCLSIERDNPYFKLAAGTNISFKTILPCLACIVNDFCLSNITFGLPEIRYNRWWDGMYYLLWIQ